MTEMWPVLEGQHQAEAAYAQALTTTSPPSVDIVPSLQDSHRFTANIPKIGHLQNPMLHHHFPH